MSDFRLKLQRYMEYYGSELNVQYLRKDVLHYLREIKRSIRSTYSMVRCLVRTVVYLAEIQVVSIVLRVMKWVKQV